jgi:hypothetical protein
VADNIKPWPNLARCGVRVEHVEHRLLVVLAQTQQNAVVFFRFWIFGRRGHVLILYFHKKFRTIFHEFLVGPKIRHKLFTLYRVKLRRAANCIKPS